MRRDPRIMKLVNKAVDELNAAQKTGTQTLALMLIICDAIAVGYAQAEREAAIAKHQAKVPKAKRKKIRSIIDWQK